MTSLPPFNWDHEAFHAWVQTQPALSHVTYNLPRELSWKSLYYGLNVMEDGVLAVGDYLCCLADPSCRQRPRTFVLSWPKSGSPLNKVLLLILANASCLGYQLFRQMENYSGFSNLKWEDLFSPLTTLPASVKSDFDSALGKIRARILADLNLIRSSPEFVSDYETILRIANYEDVDKVEDVSSNLHDAGKICLLTPHDIRVNDDVALLRKSLRRLFLIDTDDGERFTPTE